jgi:hypothetical protein
MSTRWVERRCTVAAGRRLPAKARRVTGPRGTQPVFEIRSARIHEYAHGTQPVYEIR